MLRPSSPVPIYAGIALSVSGFLLLVFTWTRVASTPDVPYQLPYIVSGGLAGIGLILVGLTVVAVQARRIQGHEQSRQIAQVGAAVVALREALLPTDDDALSVQPPSADDTADAPAE